MSHLDLLLINPSNKKDVYGRLGPSLSAIEPPLWTAIIAAFVRERGFSVKIIDAVAENLESERIAKIIIEYKPLLVAISAMGSNPSASSTPKMPAVRRILAILKKRSPRIKTALYGIHPSALPERTLREERVDFVCRGESFYTILKLLGVLKSAKSVDDYKIKGLWYLNADKIMSNGWGELVENLDELPFAAWDLLPMEKYRAHNWHCFGHIDQRQPYAAIYTSLGCAFSCNYCNICVLYNGKPGIRFRSLKKVVEELDFLIANYKIRNIKIIDELFVFKKDRVMEFCDLIIKRGYDLNMWAYARIDTVDEEILKKLKEAGVNWLCYGIEAGSQRVRNSITKGKFSQEAIAKAVKMTHDAGIYALGNFMLGLPEDDHGTMQETLNIAKELNCEYANFYTTMAYPGSPLYENALEKKIKVPNNWLQYAQLSEETAPLPTKYLSSAEVLRFRDMAFEEYHSSSRYLKLIEDKFGFKTVAHIRQMLKHKIHRKLLAGKKGS